MGCPKSGRRACWFGVDSSTLESPDVNVSCPYCYGLSPIDESADIVNTIKSADELTVQVREVTEAIYGAPDNPPPHTMILPTR